jgi:hypothetical protein
MVGRRGSQPADHTPFRSWRLPDLFFLSGFSDGRDRLGPRRPPPATVRAPHRAAAPCSAREAVALRGHPLYLWVSRRGLDPVHSVAPPHPRRIAPHCPPPEGAGGGAKRRAVGVSVEGWPCVTPPCEERGAAARRDEHFRPDDDRRGSSRSWPSEVPDRRGPGRRHDRKGVWSAGGGSPGAKARISLRELGPYSLSNSAGSILRRALFSRTAR